MGISKLHGWQRGGRRLFEAGLPKEMNGAAILPLCIGFVLFGYCHFYAL
jgi:hypothetical protein